MKALKLFIIGVLCFIVPTIAVFAVSWTDDPIKVVDEVSDKDGVQKTYVNDVGGDTVFTVLDSLKVMSVPYIQWMVYIGLGLAMFAIMYNGIILLMNLGDKSKVGVVKKRLISITVGVVLVVSAFVLLELVLSLIGNLVPGGGAS